MNRRKFANHGVPVNINAGLSILVLLLSFTAPLIAGEFEDGIAALNRRDYGAALRLLGPLADRGNATAQTDLGFLYNNGWGVAKPHRGGEMVL
jgi:uncharacterized protein